MGRAAAALSGDFVEGASTRTVDKVAIGRPNRRRRNAAVGTCLTALTEEAGLQRPRWPDGRRLFVSSEFFPSQGQDLAAIHRNNGATMNADQILAEIREANLSYLMLAQSLIRTDREQALYRLGISEESASLIALLSPAQMMKIASGNTLLCRFRMDEDDMVWGLLLNHGKSAANDATARLHASILMAGRHQEAA
jgi:flagellar transcriptional activator FlhD